MELTNRFKITGIKKKTRAKLLQDVQERDIVKITFTVGGSYHSSPKVDVELERTGEVDYKYARDVASIFFMCFDYVETSKVPAKD